MVFTVAEERRILLPETRQASYLTIVPAGDKLLPLLDSAVQESMLLFGGGVSAGPARLFCWWFLSQLKWTHVMTGLEAMGFSCSEAVITVTVAPFSVQRSGIFMKAQRETHTYPGQNSNAILMHPFFHSNFYKTLPRRLAAALGPVSSVRSEKRPAPHFCRGKALLAVNKVL